ncbi:MAG: DNA polymerase [Candidatus Micrarchaeia archaeon]
MTSILPHRLRRNEKVSFPENIAFITIDYKKRKDKITFKKVYALFKGEIFESDSKSEFWGWLLKRGYPLFVISDNCKYFQVLGFMKYLTKAGFECKAIYEDNNVFVAKFKKNKKRIILLDYKNFFKEEYHAKPVDIINLMNKKFDWLKKWWLENEMGNFGYSISTLAWNSWRHKFYKDVYIHNNEEALLLENASYYGGRVEVYKFGKFKNVFYLDFNNMYASVMKDNLFPKKLVGIIYNASKEEVKKFLQQGLLMISEVDVYSNEPIPLFPYKDPDKGLIFPNGYFRTFISTPEIIAGFNSIVKFHRLALYEGDYLFTDFIDSVYQFMDQDKKFFKLFINSLYGRWGMRKKSFELDKENFFEIDEDCIKYYDGINLVEYRRFGNNWYRKTNDFSENSFVAIASHITAYARVKLYKAMNVVGRDNLYYVDTDSLFVNEQGLEKIKTMIGKGLGQLKIKETGDLEILGLKIYRFNNKNVIVGAKKSAEISDEYYSQEEWSSIKSLISKGIYTDCYYRISKKKISNTYKKGIVLTTGEVIPYTL